MNTLKPLGFVLLLSVVFQLASCEWFHINERFGGSSCVPAPDGYNCPSLNAAFRINNASVYFINIESNINSFMQFSFITAANVVINGNNYYAANIVQSSGSVLWLQASSIIVQNLNFVNLQSTSSAVAINAIATTQFSLVNCRFDSCVTQYSGSGNGAGAVLVTLEANAFFDSSSNTFVNCGYVTSSRPLPLYTGFSGALAVINHGTNHVTVFTTNFTNNAVTSTYTNINSGIYHANNLLLTSQSDIPQVVLNQCYFTYNSLSAISTRLGTNYSIVVIGPVGSLTLNNVYISGTSHGNSARESISEIWISHNIPQITFTNVYIYLYYDIQGHTVTGNLVVFDNLPNAHFYFSNFVVNVSDLTSSNIVTSAHLLHLQNSNMVFSAISDGFNLYSNYINITYIYVDQNSRLQFLSAPTSAYVYLTGTNELHNLYAIQSYGTVVLDPSNRITISLHRTSNASAVLAYLYFPSLVNNEFSYFILVSNESSSYDLVYSIVTRTLIAHMTVNP